MAILFCHLFFCIKKSELVAFFFGGYFPTAPFKLLFFNIVQNLDNYSIRFYEVVYLQMLILQGLFA